MPTNDNNKKGELLEKYVASLYEALNFRVHRNVLIAGQQVDVVAERTLQGMGHTKLLIDCKFLSQGSVANQEIYNWGSFVRNVHATDHHVIGVIVSNREFSDTARQAALTNGITLLTEAELESDIYQLKEGCLRIVNEYENDEFFNSYLPLEAKGIKPERKKLDIGETITAMSFNDWIKTKFITILADFGSGKTTLMQWLNYRFAQKYLEGSKMKPLYVELKSMSDFQDLDLLLMNAFRTIYLKDIPKELLWKGIEHGDFIIFLDGFDEMSPEIDRDIRILNLRTLSKVLLSRSNCILTCRSSYYITDDELEKSIEMLNGSLDPGQIFHSKPHEPTFVKNQNSAKKLLDKLANKYADNIRMRSESDKVGANAIIYELSELSTKKIEDYLRKHAALFEEICKSTWSEVRDFCYSIYDISDLLKKPILISMIKDTILHMGEEYRQNENTFDPSSLYEVYTAANFIRETTKGRVRQFLSQEQRKRFAELVAWEMFLGGKLEITLNQLNRLIGQHPDILYREKKPDNLTIERVAADVLLCVFVKRTDLGGFKFIHKSFMEFFVAKTLKGQLQNKNQRSLREFEIIQEVLYFLGCYANVESWLKSFLINVTQSDVKSKRPFFKRNAAIALISSLANHQGLVVRLTTFSNIKLSDKTFIKGDFESTTFVKAFIVNTRFEDTVLNMMEFDQVEMSNTRFLSVKGDLSFVNSSLLKIQWSNCINIKLRFKYTIGQELSMQNSFVELNGDIDFRDGEIFRSSINVENCFQFALDSYFLEQTDILIDNAHNLRFTDSKIENTLLNIGAEKLVISNCKLSCTDVIAMHDCTFQNSEISSTSLSYYLNCNIISSQFAYANFQFLGNSYVSSKYIKSNFYNCHFKKILLEYDSVNEFLSNSFNSCTGSILVKFEKSVINSKRFNAEGVMKLGNLTIIDVAGSYKENFFDETIDQNFLPSFLTLIDLVA